MPNFGIEIASARTMSNGTVVLAGNLPIRHLALDSLVSGFGWELKHADGLRGLERLSGKHNVVATIFSPVLLDLAWEQALQSVLELAPKALPILCHGFAEEIDWEQAAAAGAFHSLLVPFDLQEVRQSLGFVWDAKSRSAIVPIRQRSHQRRSAHVEQRARATGIGA